MEDGSHVQGGGMKVMHDHVQGGDMGVIHDHVQGGGMEVMHDHVQGGGMMVIHDDVQDGGTGGVIHDHVQGGGGMGVIHSVGACKLILANFFKTCHVAKYTNTDFLLRKKINLPHKQES